MHQQLYDMDTLLMILVVLLLGSAIFLFWLLSEAICEWYSEGKRLRAFCMQVFGLFLGALYIVSYMAIFGVLPIEG